MADKEQVDEGRRWLLTQALPMAATGAIALGVLGHNYGEHRAKDDSAGKPKTPEAENDIPHTVGKWTAAGAVVGATAMTKLAMENREAETHAAKAAASKSDGAEFSVG